MMIFEMLKARTTAADLKAVMLEEKYVSILDDRSLGFDGVNRALAPVNAAMDAVEREIDYLGAHTPVLTREQDRWLANRNRSCAADENRTIRRIRRVMHDRGWTLDYGGASRHVATAPRSAPVDMGLQETAKAMHVRVRTLARVQGQTGKSAAELRSSMRAALKQAHGVSPDQAFSDYWEKK